MKSGAMMLLGLLVMVGCASTKTVEEKRTGPAKVLIIGDSISMGYMPPLVAALEGKAEVVHNPGNAAHSAHGLKNIDAWLGDTDWDVIHINHGLHDLKFVDANGKNVKDPKDGKNQIPVDQYEANLDAMIARIKERSDAKLIFATTTAFPDRPGGPVRFERDVHPYNDAAVRVMKKHGVAINDLYAFSAPRLKELQQPNNVHFTQAGSKALAEEVARHVLAAMAEAGW